MPTYLAGDIGGTKTELALYEDERAHGGPLRERRAARYPSADAPDLLTLIRRFLGAAPLHLDGAAFGVAGPVVGERSQITNLPWLIDAAELRRELAVPHVALLNDFHALALGLDLLPPHQLEPLQEGLRDPCGPSAVIGAGTGLGQAIIVPTATGPRILATEGGHSDFAPRDDLEIDLLRALRRRHAHVSGERLISGPGFVTLYELLVELGHLPPERDPQIKARFEREDPAAVITDRALVGHDPVYLAVIDRFISLYGAEAGNLALKTLPTGGLYVAGGIAPRLRSRLHQGGFIAAFRDKGRMQPLLTQIPVLLGPRSSRRPARSARPNASGDQRSGLIITDEPRTASTSSRENASG
jgi:glucokinase